VEKNSVMTARRDIPGKAGKSSVPNDQISHHVAKLLVDIQASLLERATAFRDANIFDPKDYPAFKDVIEHGWALSWWCGDAECEAKIKEDTKATTRCIPFEQQAGAGTCIYCGKPANEKVYFARAY